MDRRAFLVGAGGAASALGGCVGPVALGGSSVAERDLPERPAEPTPESVAAYAADYEEVRAHNRHAREDATEVTVEAVATFDHASGDECVATAQHAGTAYYEDDGARSFGELYGDPVPYLVAPDRTLRMPVTGRQVEGGAADRPPDETTAPPLGVRLCNVTDEPREFAVRVVRRSAASDADGVSGSDTGAVNGTGDPDVHAVTDGDLVCSATVALDPERAVELLGVTDVRGGYRVTASMEDGGVTGQGRIEVGLPGVDRGPDVDMVVDKGGVSAWDLPAFEAI